MPETIPGLWFDTEAEIDHCWEGLVADGGQESACAGPAA